MLPAPSTAGASRPSTEIAWRAHSRSATLPAPVSETPSSTPAWRRKSASGRSAPGQSNSCRPATATAAVVVVQRGQRARQREQRVGRGAAELAAVQRAATACARSPSSLPWPRSDSHSVGSPSFQLPPSQMTITSARSRSGSRSTTREQLLAAVLLGALDQHLDRDRRPALPRAQRGQVGDDAGLVVGRRRGRTGGRRAASGANGSLRQPSGGAGWTS